MTDIKISFTFGNESLPAGYIVKQLKKWGEDEIMLAAGYDCVLRGNVGQFSMIEPYLEKADGSWVGQWGAVNPNVSNMTNADLQSIAAMQIADEFTVQQKMNYLYWDDSNGDYVAEVWGTGPYQNAPQGHYGHMAHAGQLVAVSSTPVSKLVHMPNETGKRYVSMRELLLFRRSDFGKTYESHPWLVQRCTVSLPPNNRYGSYPRGFVYMTTMLDPRDFPSNAGAVKAFMPDEWMV